jgi:cobalt-zinc-cadmium resistance protein CzcA
MLHRLIEIAMRQRAAVLLAALILVGVGGWAASRLPIDAVPDITNPQVQINTGVPALAPEEVEKLVTFPIESEMAGLPDMMELRSLSKFGLSQVTMTFKDGVDLYRLRQLVTERLQGVLEDLPPGDSRRASRRSPRASARSSTTASITPPTRRTSPRRGRSNSWRRGRFRNTR